MGGFTNVPKRLIREYRARGLRSVFVQGSRQLFTRPAPLSAFIKYKEVRNALLLDGPRFPVLEPIWVDPVAIVTYNPSFSRVRNVGDVIGGDWDRNGTAITRTPRYQGLEEHFLDGVPWGETILFEYLRDQLDEHGRVDNCVSEDELMRRYEGVDRLYESIAANGYDPDLDPATYDGIDRKVFECVCIHIGRDGKLQFKGGAHHRLLISRLLEIDEIPARVIVRHTGWQERRSKVWKGKAAASSISDHPDVAGLR